MKLSIIIPVYNVEEYLEKCLGSVVTDCADYEIIAVNDGSTDGSKDILLRYKKLHSDLISLVDKENGGLGSARNAGLEKAKGDYVLFLDSDDYLSENAVNEILGLIDTTDADICLFDQAFYNEDGKQLMCFKGCDNSGPFTLKSYPKVLFFTPNAGNKLFKRELFTVSGIQFPPRQWFEDVNSVYMLYCYAKKIIYTEKAWNCHLQRTGSITHSKNTKRNLEMISACAELLDFYKSKDIYSQIRDELEWCIYYNEFLTSIDRVNLIDSKSEVQKELKDWFKKTFPDFESENPYYKTMSKKYRLLHFLINNDMYFALNCVLRANDRRHQ